jgi:hypothetical protein
MQLKELGLTTANAAAQDAAGLNIRLVVTPVLFFIEKEQPARGNFQLR